MDTVIIQVYMPTSEHLEEDADGIYDRIEGLIEESGRNVNLIIMGDMNSVIGDGRDGRKVGLY